jgi:hypothetical protein
MLLDQFDDVLSKIDQSDSDQIPVSESDNFQSKNIFETKS